MNGTDRYLIDTNILINFLQGEEVPESLWRRNEMIERKKGVKGTEQGALYELPGGWESNLLAFICVHPRLIFDREMRGVSAT